MLRWLRRLFKGCDHRWRTIQVGELSVQGKNGEWSEIGRRYTLRCETCGSITHYDAR